LGQVISILLCGPFTLGFIICFLKLVRHEPFMFEEMMTGFKWKLFCLHLSFIGWAILAILSLCIGYLWLVPYMYASLANFYENLKATYLDKISSTDFISVN